MPRVQYDHVSGERIGEALSAEERAAQREEERERARAREEQRGALILSTTHDVQGATIVDYLGLVFGEAILGANIFSDVAAGVRDVVGGRSASYEGKMADARDIALRELGDSALDLSANAVVGIKLDYETIKGSMLMVTAQGTAVALKRDL